MPVRRDRSFRHRIARSRSGCGRALLIGKTRMLTAVNHVNTIAAIEAVISFEGSIADCKHVGGLSMFEALRRQRVGFLIRIGGGNELLS